MSSLTEWQAGRTPSSVFFADRPVELIESVAALIH